ncbi:MAG: HAD family phosphatase [Firmicutes bacterium]|nr:HAD family phosphatase [Bacillota bacterium]
MSIRMIGLDLDGTTLDAEGSFSERTIDAFRGAMEKGAHVVIATGRAVHSLPEEIYDMDGLEYAVTSNGARIIELGTGDTIYSNFLDGESVRIAHKILKENNAMIELFYRGRAYIGADEFERITTGGPTMRNRKYVSSTRTPVDDIYALLLEGAEEIENISVNYPTIDAKLAMEDKLKAIPNVTVTSSFTYNNEIGGATTSKANALRFMMEKLSVEPEELMCCGDSPNDIAMIKLAGVGVAVGNAEEVVKEIADYIAAPHYEDGVAKAIEKFVLEK